MLSSLHDCTVELVTGEKLDLSQYKDTVMLIVNIASRCGFTPQLGSLEDLHRRYADRGLRILAFPTNDFMNQEPLSNAEIDSFCTEKYSITFPIVAKTSVCGQNKHPVFTIVTEHSDPRFQGDPGWNFVKFLVNKTGQVVGRYSSITRPCSKKITEKIEALLIDPARSENID